MLQRILVGLDGSELAETILPYVVDLARALGGDITLLSVTHLPDDAVSPEHQATADQFIERASTLAHDYLHTVEQRLAGSGVPVHTQVAVGDAPDEILRVARQEGMELIALATHGRSGVRRWLYGSVTDDVLHATRTPLLVIRPTEQDAAPHHLARLLVPLDGSELAASVLPYVEAIAKAARIPVTLLRTVEPMYLGADLSGAAAAYEQFIDSVRLAAETALDQEAGRLRLRGVVVETATPIGSPAAEIVDHAHAQPGTLVVMATHGRTGLAGAVLGSVARRVVQHAGAPILIIHPGKEA